MHPCFIFGTRQIIFARPVFVRSDVDRVNLALCGGSGCEENGRAAKISTNLQNVSRCRFHRFPKQCRFVETLPDQAAISTIAGEEPGQIFEAFNSAWSWFFHVADESLSSRRAQDVDVVLGRSKSGNCFESEIERQERTNTSAIGFSRPTQGRPRGFHRRRCAKGQNDGNPRFLGATPADCSASRSSAAFFRQGRTFLFEPNWPLRTGLSDF